MIFLNALLPIVATIAMGYALRRSGFLDGAVWPGLERLTYYVLFPALLITAIGSQRFEFTAVTDLLIVVVGTLSMASFVLMAWHRMTARVTDSTFTSVFQGGVRFNTYIALALSMALFGDEGLVVASLAAGLMIILINMVCIVVFSRWGKSTTGRSIGKELLVNPLILGCAIGWTLSVADFALPAAVTGTLQIIGRAALPMGLLAVGAALRGKAYMNHKAAIGMSSIVQFGVKPLTAYALIGLVGLTGVSAGALMISFMVPTASSGYILARQLGGDSEAMAAIITFQSVAAVALMPILAMLFLP